MTYLRALEIIEGLGKAIKGTEGTTVSIMVSKDETVEALKVAYSTILRIHRYKEAQQVKVRVE